MTDREEILAFFGLPTDATLFEIERAYSLRYVSANDRLASGDESARVELAALKEAYERLSGHNDARQSLRAPRIEGYPVGRTGVELAPPIGPRLREPAWWECYLSFLLALGSLAVLAGLIAYLPHVYHRGGFLLPLGALVLSAILSIAATMLAEGELQHGLRTGLLEHRGLDAEHQSVRLRGRVARVSSVLSRAVRWLLPLALIATVLLNFASLSGHWSLRK
ncbi:MAG: J domain-containing protein [Gaiellaceae bacterium]